MDLCQELEEDAKESKNTNIRYLVTSTNIKYFLIYGSLGFKVIRKKRSTKLGKGRNIH